MELPLPTRRPRLSPCDPGMNLSRLRPFRRFLRRGTRKVTRGIELQGGNMVVMKASSTSKVPTDNPTERRWRLLRKRKSSQVDARARDGRMELPLPKVGAMKQTPAQYVISFQAEPSYKGRRHHWMICRAQNPDELVSWGHEPTRELAEAAAGRELQDLSAGVTRGGQVATTIKPFTRHA